MIHYTPNTTGKVFQLPIIPPDKRQEVLDFIAEANKINDQPGALLVTDLLGRLDGAEATLRNMYKTLSVYRARVPKLIRKLHEKKEDKK